MLRDVDGERTGDDDVVDGGEVGVLVGEEDRIPDLEGSTRGEAVKGDGAPLRVEVAEGEGSVGGEVAMGGLGRPAVLKESHAVGEVRPCGEGEGVGEIGRSLSVAVECFDKEVVFGGVVR